MPTDFEPYVKRCEFLAVVLTLAAASHSGDLLPLGSGQDQVPDPVLEGYNIVLGEHALPELEELSFVGLLKEYRHVSYSHNPYQPPSARHHPLSPPRRTRRVRRMRTESSTRLTRNPRRQLPALPGPSTTIRRWLQLAQPRLLPWPPPPAPTTSLNWLRPSKQPLSTWSRGAGSCKPMRLPPSKACILRLFLNCNISYKFCTCWAPIVCPIPCKHALQAHAAELQTKGGNGSCTSSFCFVECVLWWTVQLASAINFVPIW